MTNGAETYACTTPKIDFVSAVGSGDAFLAAFVNSFMKDENLSESLAWGTAAGAANAACAGSGFCTKDSIFSLKDQIEVTNINSQSV